MGEQKITPRAGKNSSKNSARYGSSIAHSPSGRRHRSEEHTSELQSLMRSSYAVFCLKKKKPNNTKTSDSTNTVIITTTTNSSRITRKEVVTRNNTNNHS